MLSHRLVGRRPQPALFVVLATLLGCTERAPAASAPPAERPAPATATPATADTAIAGDAGPTRGDRPRVAFLGDSLAAGLHLPANEAFPAVLQAQLAQQGLPFALTNAGVSGDTTAGGLRRVDWVLRSRPDIVVIELGANDGLRGVQLQPIEDNLRAIVERVRRAGARPLLLGMRIPPSYGAPYADGFDALYPKLAAELDVPLVPFFMEGVAGNPDLTLPDGLHPTAAGHRRLAQNVAPVLAEALRALSAPGTDAGTRIIREVESDVGDLTLETEVAPCRLRLSRVGAAVLGLSAEPLSATARTVCKVNSARHVTAFATLGARAQQLRGPYPARLQLGIALHNQPELVARFFAYQAGQADLQKAARNTPPRLSALLADHLLRSGVLSAYGPLLSALGLRIEAVALEKVEVRSTGQWSSVRPELDLQGVPRTARLALPFMTTLTLQPTRPATALPPPREL